MKSIEERIHYYGKKGLMANLTVLCLTLLLFLNALAADAWNCPECGRTGNTGNFCGDCGHASPYIEGQTNDSSQETDTTAEFKTVGNIVIFGRYEQDNKIENGPEEIEWVVLDYDEKANKALLLSRYGLDAKPYNEKNKATTWSDCTLRTWLNDSFLNTAFTAEERNAILLTDVKNRSSQGYSDWNTSGGNNTQDKVFLLSYIEAYKYLGVKYYLGNYNSINTKSCVVPSAYAINRGAFISEEIITEGMYTGWWWLRSPGYRLDRAAHVRSDGYMDNIGVDSDDGCVRPALWINLESEFF